MTDHKRRERIQYMYTCHVEQIARMNPEGRRHRANDNRHVVIKGF